MISEISTSDNLIKLREQFVAGGISKACAYESLRVTRIDSLGGEDGFEWLVNNRRYRPKEGDYLLFSGIDLRMPIVTRCPSEVRITVLSFEPLSIFPHTGLAGIFYSDGEKLIRAGEAPAVAELFSRAADELKRGDRYSEIAASALVVLLCAELCRHFGYEPDGRRFGQSGGDKLGEIVAYLGEHFSEKLTIVSAARQLGISQSQLSKLMNNLLGVSFPEYVRRLRVANVIRLTREEGKGVLESALESGFGSVTGFYKTFRALTGSSPTEMLKSETYL